MPTEKWHSYLSTSRHLIPLFEVPLIIPRRNRYHPSVHVIDFDFEDDIAVKYFTVQNAEKLFYGFWEVDARVVAFSTIHPRQKSWPTVMVGELNLSLGNRASPCWRLKYLGSHIMFSTKDFRIRKTNHGVFATSSRKCGGDILLISSNLTYLRTSFSQYWHTFQTRGG